MYCQRFLLYFEEGEEKTMKKLLSKLIIAVFAVACISVAAPNVAKADEIFPCIHNNFWGFYKGDNQHEVVCRDCNVSFMEPCQFNSAGQCWRCGNSNYGHEVNYCPLHCDWNWNCHWKHTTAAYNDCWTCALCGYPCNKFEHAQYYYNTWTPWYHTTCYNPCYDYSVINALNNSRATGSALPANSIIMNYGGVSYDIAAISASAADTANQYLLANTLMSSIGITNFTPSKTYSLKSYLTASPAGVAQAMTWNNCGLLPGDTAYVVYWNPTSHAQLLPVTVGINGSANFIVPDINGAQITLIKVNK